MEVKLSSGHVAIFSTNELSWPVAIFFFGADRPMGMKTEIPALDAPCTGSGLSEPFIIIA